MIDHISRRPGHIVVAILTDICRRYVRRIFADRVGTVVAVEAAIDNIDVIKIGRYPCRRRVAVIAVFAALNVGRILASRRRTVVAGIAGTQHMQVIDGNGRVPEICTVTVLADVRCRDVRGTFTGCIGAIVATEAVARDVPVIDNGRHPCQCRVTVITLFTRDDMRRVLAGRIDAVMTGSAGPRDGDVIHEGYRAPGRRRMAVDAHARISDVIGRH